MKKQNERYYISRLVNQVESRAGFSLSASSDFARLSDIIEKNGKGILSESTLKRLWGYVSSGENIHRNTLDILASFAGYDGYEAFKASIDSQNEIESGFLGKKCVGSRDIPEGETLRLSWRPDRKISLRKTGSSEFEVTESFNSKLQAGTRVEFGEIVVGKPLIMRITNYGGKETLYYEAGKSNGVFIED